MAIFCLICQKGRSFVFIERSFSPESGTAFHCRDIACFLYGRRPCGGRTAAVKSCGAGIFTGIKGQDDRTSVEVSQYPWRSIGRINRNGRFCTGVLIGSDKVMTAAHCFWNKRTQTWAGKSDIHFVAGYDRGKYLAHSKIKNYRISRLYPPDFTHGEPKRPSRDWAIVTLQKPLGDEIGFLPVARFSAASFAHLKGRKDTRIIQAGYSRDYAHILTVHTDCKILSVGPHGQETRPVVMHKCDATMGDSGSPIFLETKGKYALIALHVATAVLPDAEAIGIAVPSISFLAEF